MANSPPHCPITGLASEHLFEAKVLCKYNVNYYYCHESGLVITEKPYWLEEAYSSAIAATDTGLVTRNINNQRRLEPVLDTLFDDTATFLDLGGGYGMLTRLLRDYGFNCYTYDAYCENLFAPGFEPSSTFEADAVLAFEVLEHIENPYQFIIDAFNTYNCRSIIFSTLTFEGTPPSKDWWYYSFETGQHITFYQPKSLRCLASKLGCTYYQLNDEFHIITDINISKKQWLMLTDEKLKKREAKLIRKKRKKFSKTWEDHLILKQKLVSSISN